MSLFWDLVKFEYKKALCKKSSIWIIIIGTLFIVLSVFGTLLGYSYDENGNRKSSYYEEMLLDREYERQLSGREINSELLMEAVTAYRKVPLSNTTRYYTSTEEYSEYARKYSPIYALGREVYHCSSIEDFQALTKEQADAFYEKWEKNHQAYIMQSRMSDKAKTVAMEELSKVQEPFVFEYTGGYQRYFAIMYTSAMIAAAIMAIIFAPVFSGEYTSGTDQLILASKHGKRLLIIAKLFVVYTFTVIYSIFIMLATFAETMLVWGMDGKDAAVQLIIPDSFYNGTLGELALVYSFIVLLACLVLTAVTACMSSVMKSSFWVIIASCLLLFVPMFITVSEKNILLYNLFCLLPSNMMAWESLLYTIPYYELFGQVIQRPVVFSVFATLLAIVLVPVTYRSFKRHQIA